MPTKANRKSHLSIDGLPAEWLFPTTRYRGSKRKILPWIWGALKDIEFDSALDLFGGSGIVAYLFKRMGKSVIYNDYLRFNKLSADALVKNNGIILTDDDIDFLIDDQRKTRDRFISKTFKGQYFLDDENGWLDKTIGNITNLDQMYSGNSLATKRAMAFWALGQSCLIKRPFNLFHRRNLQLRINHIESDFGNKATWETPFPIAMRRFITEANSLIFDNAHQHKTFCLDALSSDFPETDLVYLDPPYFFRDQRDTDYRNLYHFLEGIIEYDKWPSRIDFSTYNLRLKKNGVHWPTNSASELAKIYESLIKRFRRSTILISHKSNSLVSIGTLKGILERQGKRTKTYWRRYNYALSRNNGKPRENIEWLILGL